MSVLIDGCGSRKTNFMQTLHVSELFGGRKPREVKPIVLSSALEIVTVILDGFEGLSSQPS